MMEYLLKRPSTGYNTEKEREFKIKFIVEQEKNAKNSWKWVEKADDKTINDLYEYWTQEM